MALERGNLVSFIYEGKDGERTNRQGVFLAEYPSVYFIRDYKDGVEKTFAKSRVFHIGKVTAILAEYQNNRYVKAKKSGK